MAEKPTPGAKARPWRRALLVAVAIALLAIVLVLSGGGVWLTRTDRGTAWLLSHIASLSNTSGRLLGGPFSAERAELKLGQRTLTIHGLAWQDAHWSWRPHESAWVGLVLVAPRAERVELQGAGGAEPLTLPASLRMPVTLVLQDLRIAALHIDGMAPVTQIAGNATLGAREGKEHRIADLAFNWDRARMQARGSIASDAPFVLELAADARALEGSTPPWQATATARGPLDKLALQVALGSDKAPGATLRAEANVLPFAPWPLATLAATAQDLDLAALGSGLPTTRLSGRAEIDTRSLDAPVTARIGLVNTQAGRWDQQRLPVTRLDLDLAGLPRDRSRLTVKALSLQLMPGAGRIEGSGDWQAGAARLALRLQALRPALLDARAAAMTLSGSTTFALQGLPSPDGKTAPAASQQLRASLALDGRLDARGDLPLQVSAEAEGERSASGMRIDLRELLLRSRDARAQGSLSVSRDTARNWQLLSRGELAGFDPALWFTVADGNPWRKGPHRLAGRWRADVQGGPALAAARTVEARLLALRGDAELNLQDSQLAGVPLQLGLKLDGRGPGWALDADLRSGSNRATLLGRLAPLARDDRWKLGLDLPALGALQPMLDLIPNVATALRGATKTPIAGQLGGEVQAQGRWPALRIDADLRASALQAANLRATRLQLKAQAGPDAQSTLAVQVEGEQLAFDTLRADTLAGRLDGSLAEHRLTLDLLSPVRPPAWTDAVLGRQAAGTRFALRGSGQWAPADPRQGLLPGRWRGQVLDLDVRDRSAPAAAAGSAPPWLRARDLRLQLQLAADGRLTFASAEPGRAEVLGSALRWTEAEWRAGASNVPSDARVDLQLEPMAIAPWLHKLEPAAGLGGNLLVGGRARIQLGQRVAADVVLERASGDLTRTDETGTQAFGLTDLRLAVAAQDGTWHFTQAVAGRNVGVLAGAQSLRLAPQARWPRPDSPMQGVLEWQVADLGAWAPFLPLGWRVGGALRVGAALGGSFGAPEITGDLVGTRLAVRNLLQGVDVRDGELALSLRGNQASIDRFVFKGGKGELRVTGGASLGTDPRARLQLNAERFQLLGRIDRRIVTSGSAALELSPQTLALDGRFRIDEGLIDFSRGDAPSLDSDVQVRGGRAGTPAEAIETEAPAPRANAATRSARVALQVDLGDELTVRGRGLDTKLRGSLALSTPGGQLAVNGSVRTEAGTYAAYGQKLDIERGVLVFTGPAGNPRLDILALRPNLDLRVGVQVSGSSQFPRVRLISEPEMSDTDKLAWLVLGRAPDGLARTDTALLQRAALALLAGEGQGLDRTLLSNIGLDEFSVSQRESGEVRDTVVSLGKQLSRRWYVGYERGLNSTTGTWQLIYRVAQRFTLRAQAGEDNALDAIWAWRWD
ncbi:MAG: translocation/assembly module TamB domain-containing protein [Pseudomonadota bacterium]